MRNLFILIFFFLSACGDISKNTSPSNERGPRSFNSEELIQFEREIDSVSSFEKASKKEQQGKRAKEIADAIHSESCLVQIDQGFIQKEKWLEKNIYIGPFDKHSCAVFGSYRMRKLSLNSYWQNNFGFSILNSELAKKNEVNSFYLKLTGEKNKTTGEGFWFSNKYGKAQVRIHREENKLQIFIVYNEFQVSLQAEKIKTAKGYSIIATRGPDRISQEEFQNYLDRLGSISENLQL